MEYFGIDYDSMSHQFRMYEYPTGVTFFTMEFGNSSTDRKYNCTAEYSEICFELGEFCLNRPKNSIGESAHSYDKFIKSIFTRKKREKVLKELEI